MLIVLLVPAFDTSSREYTLPAALDKASTTILQSELFNFYYHQPSVQQSLLNILNRLKFEVKIRDKLTLYSLAVNEKNFFNLNRIYIKNAVIEVSSDYSLFKELKIIKKASEKSIKNINTRLLLRTQIIKIYENDLYTASSFIYFISIYLSKDMLVRKIRKS